MSTFDRARRSQSMFRPIKVTEVELSAPIPELVGRCCEDGHDYGSALTVVRLHSVPLGLVETPLTGGGVSAESHARAVWTALGTEVNAHLRSDGLELVKALTAEGLPEPGVPVCIEARAAFLRDAPPISIIIPTRERPERLGRCLDSILGGEYPSGRLEVIVADNAPVSDRTRAVVDRYSKDTGRVHYVREDASGSASARNRALEVTQTEIVLFTDDDVAVDRHWAAETARAFFANDDVDCVTGLLLPGELDTLAQIWFEEYGGFSRGFQRRVYDLGPNRPKGEPLYPFAAGIFGTGNNMAFRRSSLRATGDFDPALGNGTPALGGVDSEVLLRTILAGQRIAYEPRSVVYHLHRPDYDGLRRQVYHYGAGLTAYLLKTMLANPSCIPDFACKVPRGIAFALNPKSGKNEGKSTTYPRELTRLELRGMLYGPVAYARSRRKYGPHRGAA